MSREEIDDVSSEVGGDNVTKAIDSLMDGKTDIDLKTHLSEDEIQETLRLLFICQLFKIKRGERFCEKFMRLKLSKDRLSRQEIIALIRADAAHNADMGLGAKIKGMIGGGAVPL